MEIDSSFERMKLSSQMEKTNEWRKWSEEIPYIPFKKGWFVKITPPMTGAIVRFRVSLSPDFEKDVSIYLDCYDTLGSYGGPYWEIYPHGGDTFRCGMKEVDRLLKAIEESLKEVFPRNEMLKIKLDSLELDNE